MASITARPVRELQRPAPTPLLLPVRLWHLLSLDAPTVAVLWMLFFERARSGTRTLHEAAALGLAVWLLYIADRLLDARESGGILRERHLFHHRHRRLLLTVLLLCLPLLMGLVFGLPANLRAVWLLLSLPLLLYAVIVHRWHPSRLPKELFVALFFATAIAIPALLQHPPLVGFIAQSTLFGALCWLNCIGIARWEGGPPSTFASSTLRGSRSFCWVGATLLVSSAACALALQMTGTSCLPELACALSACLLLLLDRARKHIGAVELRGLADAALLTPLLLWPFLR